MVRLSLTPGNHRRPPFPALGRHGLFRRQFRAKPLPAQRGPRLTSLDLHPLRHLPRRNLSRRDLPSIMVVGPR